MAHVSNDVREALAEAMPAENWSTALRQADVVLAAFDVYPRTRRKARAPHQHESWQIRESAKGGYYCAACGDTVGQSEVLDPTPYRRIMGDDRYASRAEAPNTIALVFDPRREYVQHEVMYPKEAQDA